MSPMEGTESHTSGIHLREQARLRDMSFQGGDSPGVSRI